MEPGGLELGPPCFLTNAREKRSKYRNKVMVHRVSHRKNTKTQDLLAGK